MDVSLAPEVIFHLGSFSITNSILTAWLISLFLIIGALLVRHFLKIRPNRFQTALELTYTWLLTSTEDIIGRTDVAREIFPYISTIFFFILISNWSGMLPGFNSFGVKEIIQGKNILIPLFRAPTTDLNMVLVMALFSVGFVEYLGIKYSGFKIYLSRFFNFHDPISFFVGIIELISEFTRIISFSFRLFGNIFAGEVLIMVMFYLTIHLLPLIPILPIPFFLIEIFVGAIQAFVFCFLTMVFIALAIESHNPKGYKQGGEELSLLDVIAETEENLIHDLLTNNK